MISRYSMHSIRCCIYYIVFLLFPLFPLFSQVSQFKNYSIKDGLPSSEVYHVMQDSKGYMWFSTDRGVSRFNGYEFKTFTKSDGLADNTVFESHEDNKGRIWFRSYSGKISYYYHDSIFRLCVNDSIPKILKGSIVTSLNVDDDEQLYMSAHGIQKIIKIDLNHSCRIDLIEVPEEHVYTLRLRSGAIGIGHTYNSHLKHHDTIIARTLFFDRGAGNAEVRTARIFNWRIRPEDKLNTVMRYRAARLSDGTQVLTFNARFFLFDKDSLKETFAAVNTILWLYPDKQGGVWALPKGAVPFYYRRGEITYFPQLDFLKGKFLTSMTMDAEGGLWFTSQDNGAYYLNSLDFKLLNTENGLPGNKIYGMAVSPDKKLWASNIEASDVISIIDHTAISNYKVPEFAKWNSTVNPFLFCNDRSIILGTLGAGAFIFEDGFLQRKLHSFSSSGHPVASVIQNKDSSIWAAGMTSLGLYKREKNSLIEKKYFILNTKIFVICKDADDQLLIGAIDGLWQYSDGLFINCGKQIPLFKNRIEDMKLASDGGLWIATRDTGIIVKRGSNLVHITTKEGLLSNFCRSLFIDSKGGVWVGTNEGLSHITPVKGSTSGYHIENLKNIIGLNLNEINHICGIDNQLYIATNNGIIEFDMDKVKPDQIPPPVYISGIKINNKDTTCNPGKAMQLNYESNYIVLNYIGLTYQEAGNALYRYRMEGIDTAWVYTRYRSVQYPKLPPGKYNFSVEAMNKDGAWSTTPAEAAFIISPPFWDTWWFRIIVVLTVISLVYWRVRIVIKRTKEKAETAQQITAMELKTLRMQTNPHFLFNSLNTLTELVEDKSDDAPVFVNELSKFYRYSLQQRDKEIIELDNEIRQLQGFIYMLKIRFRDHLNIKWAIQERHKLYFIPTHTLQLLFENITKHNAVSSANPLWVEISTTDEDILILKNQRQPKKGIVNSTGLGLATIKERYRILTDKKINIIETSEYFSVELPLISHL